MASDREFAAAGKKIQHPFHEILRKHGYKATTQRLAIFAIFKNARHPMSAQEIIDALPSRTASGQKKVRRIDPVTIYRALKSFKSKGIIRQVDLRHNHAHYELADAADHHHLACVRCGRIEDVPHAGAAALEAAVLRSAKHFAEIHQHSLEFYGICKTCAKKTHAAEVPSYKDAPL